MCEFCGKESCTLTKQQTVEHGPIIEDNVSSIMREPTDEHPQTYVFEKVPAYYSLSALIPDEDEDDPHLYKRYVFDEDTGCDGDWETREIQSPLSWQTEAQFLEKGKYDEHYKMD